MRILLTNCPLGRKQPIIFPLGLAYIASVIAEHDVQCLDQSNASPPFAELTDRLMEFNPEIIGISLRNIDSLTSSDIYSFFQNFVDILLHIKQHSPHAVIITGGAGFSLFGKEVMEQVINTALNKSNVEALILSRDINLPPPIPLPKIKGKAK